MKRKGIYSLAVIVVVALVYFMQICVPHEFNQPDRVIQWDVRSYYSYLPGIFVEHDIQFSSWDTNLRYQHYYYPVWIRDNKYLIKTSCGVAMLYFPFFICAHALAMPLGYAPNGFSAPYTFALLLSGAFYVICGLLIIRKWLLRRFSDKVTAATILIISLTTPLYWYAAVESPMPHSYSFFLFAVFIYLTELWYENPTWKYSILGGITFGLITLIRPSNALIIIVFFLYGISRWNDVPQHFRLYGINYTKVMVMLAMVFLVWVPQFIYWKFITGHFMFYSYRDEGFFWNDPKIYEVLFGFRKGLFIYSPVLIFAVVGMIWVWKKHREFFWATIVFCIFNVYVIASWWCWWYGGSFGMRSLVDSFPILVLPLAAFLTWVAECSRRWRISLMVVVTLFAAQSGFHIIQYFHGAIHYEAMSKKAYKDSFWRVKPSSTYWNKLDWPDYEAAQKGEKR